MEGSIGDLENVKRLSVMSVAEYKPIDRVLEAHRYPSGRRYSLALSGLMVI